jgi:hypothetical protein
MALLFVLGAVAPVWTQEQRVEQFQGRHAYVLQNRQIRVSALRGGGHIAEVRFLSDDPKKGVNPMRVPHYPTIEPYEYDPARHDAIYGSDPHRWLSSGYMGHLLCFPAFGPPSSPEEVKSGLGNHGEAPIVEWKPIGSPATEGGALRFHYGADLPKTQYRVERVLTLAADESVLYVEETVQNLAPYDRPINWVQHATFGPPFIEPGKSYLDLSGTKGRVSGGAVETSSLQPNSEFEWPDGTGAGGGKVSLRMFQPKPAAGTYFAVLMDQQRPVSYFTMYNPEFPVLIGYLFRTDESPWVGDFQENRRLKNKPWDGKAVTRGIEFGTTPFAEGLRRSVERGSLFGARTYRWIGGREKLKTTWALFLAAVSEEFKGVEEVALNGGEIVLRERGSQRQVVVRASRLSLLR